MRISLELVREILRGSLGRDSFIASFISKVREDPSHPTAGITSNGVFMYNPSFVKANVHSKGDLFSLILHEALHPAFSHFIHKNNTLENIACDAIINAVISSIYQDESGNGSLFRRFYPKKGILALLRPGSRLQDTRYKKVYEALYPWSSRSQKTTSGDICKGGGWIICLS